MSRSAQTPVLRLREWVKLRAIAASRIRPSRDVLRANIVLLSADGAPDASIARKLGISPKTVGKWRKRFNSSGIKGLKELPRSGRPPRYDRKETEGGILQTVSNKPPKGQTVWDAKSIALRLNMPVHYVWRRLREYRICLNKFRSWCVSRDKHFAAKAADIIKVYTALADDVAVYCIDEKTSVQALYRRRGFAYTSSRLLMYGREHVYRRNGTTNLIAAMNVRTGRITYILSPTKKRTDFLRLLELVVANHPSDQEIHIVMDNYAVHKNIDAFLELHPNVKPHYTPTSASWMNMIEIWFGMVCRKVLRNGSFGSVEELEKALEDFIEVHNINPKPYKWRKREVKGSQLRDTLANLRD
jgi:transposase